MSFFKNFVSQVKNVAEKGKQSFSKAIESIASQSLFNEATVVLPWEREDLEPSVQAYLKEEILRISLV